MIEVEPKVLSGQALKESIMAEAAVAKSKGEYRTGAKYSRQEILEAKANAKRSEKAREEKRLKRRAEILNIAQKRKEKTFQNLVNVCAAIAELKEKGR